MEFSSALLYLSKFQNATCRRTSWGESVKHIYLNSDFSRGDSLILVNEAGGETQFFPSFEDYFSCDWKIK